MLPFEQISRAIAVRHVMTPMSAAITISSSDSPARALKVLNPGRFDQAPVMDGERLVGLVTRNSLNEAAGRSSLPVELLDAKYLISDDTSVGAALPRLLVAPILFVVDESGFAGFITQSDMNKHPVRTHFYLLLADLEMTMAQEARTYYRDPAESLATLSNGRRAKVEDRHKLAQDSNVDADVLTAFEFPDLLCMIRKSRLYHRFGYTAATGWHSDASTLTTFRDHVMHPTSDMLGTWTITKLVSMERKLRDMLNAAASPAPGLGT